MSEIGALLLERKTRQGHTGAFEPMLAGDPFADVMNTIPKCVVSTTLATTYVRRNATLIKRNVIAEVCALKAQDGKQIIIDGTSTLLRRLA
jgi:hypothetical protein